MSIASTVILVAFYLLFPALILYFETKQNWIRKLSPVVICYLSGAILGNIGLLPKSAIRTQDLINTIVIPLAIPMLLFSIDISKWWRMATATFTSLILGVLSAVIMVVLGFFILRPDMPDLWKVSGMLIGLYTGGTPNIASIQLALNVDPNVYIVTHTYDLVVGAFLLLFLITLAQRFFLLFLRPFKSADASDAGEVQSQFLDEFSSYQGIFKRGNFLPLLGAFGIAVLIFGIMGGISLLLPESAQMPVVILGITTLAILASMLPKVNRIGKTFQAGMYLILIFCLVVASMADLSVIFRDMNWPLMLYVLLAVPGALLLHAFLSWIFRVDADNMIISSTALSMSPIFVPIVAAAIKNKEIILSGIIIGVVGYAIGNYLGIGIAYFLEQYEVVVPK